ncbi:ATP-dependent RNA helicase DDX50-like [Mya arenaria]|uniref:ATP-dependent RNA helicase DDX50-like n=1 Tax=Mya arenaria TaxID=6604 RepID=UPI0022E318FA|nr:ATP-dependent RNA helicase DDX50-like [Mya arenaria]
MAARGVVKLNGLKHILKSDIYTVYSLSKQVGNDRKLHIPSCNQSVLSKGQLYIGTRNNWAGDFLFSRRQFTVSTARFAVTPQSASQSSSDEEAGAFEKFNISEKVQHNLKGKGIHFLFPVQYHTFQHTLEGTDVVVQARTGTGKTLSFSLPLVEKLCRQPALLRQPGRKPRVLILAPTRELANQVHEDFAFLDRDIKVACVFGGAKYEPQVERLRTGVDVVVGTPGRMKDLMDSGHLKLDAVQHVILDEVDQMLDMGFQHQVDEIISSFYERDLKPQTMLYSATMPDWVKKTANKYLSKDYEYINLVGKQNEQTATTIKQYSMQCTYKEKESLLQDLIRLHSNGDRVIIFCGTKIECDRLAQINFGGGSRALHGDIAQASRSVIMKGFKDKQYNVLITTDVAARGLDVPDVSLVIQTQPPQDVSKYIHRVGRTGRAGKEGKSVLLYQKDEWEIVKECEAAAKTKFEKMPAPDLKQMWEICSKDATKSIENVSSSVLAQFMKPAEQLVQSYGAVETIAAAIVVISGAEKFANRSLITREPGKLTLLIKSLSPVEGYMAARRKVNNYLSAEKLNVGSVELTQDRKGIVFDMPLENIESFAEEFDDLKEDAGETLERLEQLPPLLQIRSDSFTDRSGQWKQQQGGNRGWNRGSSNSSYGKKSSSYSDYGSRDSGSYGNKRSSYGDYGSRDSGSYGNKRSSYGDYGSRDSGSYGNKWSAERKPYRGAWNSPQEGGNNSQSKSGFNRSRKYDSDDEY